jgi:hypothetical protein
MTAGDDDLDENSCEKDYESSARRFVTEFLMNEILSDDLDGLLGDCWWED